MLNLKSNDFREDIHPSSVFVESFPLSMGEHAAAKAAGETVCTFLEKASSGLVVYKPRLPIVSTDQTATIGSKNREDPFNSLWGG